MLKSAHPGGFFLQLREETHIGKNRFPVPSEIEKVDQDGNGYQEQGGKELGCQQSDHEGEVTLKSSYKTSVTAFCLLYECQ